MKKNNYIDFGERGQYNINNKLNDLTGKEWIKFSKSWFIHNPPKRKTIEVLHPAKYPESLVEEFVKFFTKKNEWVFDPFVGTGSTLIAALNSERNSVGIELNKNYYEISKKRISGKKSKNNVIIINGDSKNAVELLKLKSIEQIDYTITSPPYWNQLERTSIRQKKRKENGLDTKYSEQELDLGNVKSYDEFLELQAKIFDQVYDLTKPFGYLTIITNNIYYKSKLFPLAYDTAISLTKRGENSWTLKDEKIWLHNDKALIALGINNAWVGNRHHQYCLIFRKEI